MPIVKGKLDDVRHELKQFVSGELHGAPRIRTAKRLRIARDAFNLPAVAGRVGICAPSQCKVAVGRGLMHASGEFLAPKAQLVARRPITKTTNQRLLPSVQVKLAAGLRVTAANNLIWGARTQGGAAARSRYAHRRRGSGENELRDHGMVQAGAGGCCGWNAPTHAPTLASAVGQILAKTLRMSLEDAATCLTGIYTSLSASRNTPTEGVGRSQRASAIVYLMEDVADTTAGALTVAIRAPPERLL
ncbi:hypothetical protein ONZ51_g4193 [Trametes cubensis]|uniref:Uncharacterized protein n=1 Tax=Trametes cubensis TaxID=1111947 RepID=A0AAD7XEY1_9APHY|nr:hypothetical protein ONZ51_g4193 [Trametes cubensis]